MLPPECTKIVSPISEKHQEWEKSLQTHPDKVFASYIINGVKYGFKIGYAQSKRSTATTNLLSAMVHPEVVEKYLEGEVQAARLRGPFPRSSMVGVHCSPFGVIPKSDQISWRLIVDLSSPKGGSVNDGIQEELASISYVTVDTVVRRILDWGQGTILAKTDVKSAFRIIPVHPSDRWLLGLQWKNDVYIDTVLPFGLRSAPKIFNAVADAVQFIARKRGIQSIVHYLDDFLILGHPKSKECKAALDLFSTICEQMGIPLAPEKTMGPAIELEFLGIGLNTEKMIMFLPDRKRQGLRDILGGLQRRKSASKEELQSLAGRLQHASKVIKPGRCYIRSAYELSSLRQKPHDRIRLTKEFKADLAWWATFIDQWNGTSLLWDYLHQYPEVNVISDASGSWGCGAIAGDSWIQHQWYNEPTGMSIAHKELVPIIMASFIWGKQWSGKVVQFWSDNEAVVVILNKLSAKEKQLSHLLRCMVFLAARWNFWFVATHIPGKDNQAADAISRNDMSRFYSQAPVGTAKEPTEIPTGLPQWIYVQPPDWLSPAWMELFKNFMQRD